MKASNSRDATPAEYLEYLRLRSGLEHARFMRDKLGWGWNPSAMLWTVRHSALAWAVAAGSALAGVASFATNLNWLVG